MTMMYGIGFALKAVDRNVKSTVRKAERGLDRLVSSMERLGRESQSNRFGRFLEGLQLHRLNQIGAAVERMADASPKLSNGLESTAIAINKDLAKAWVGMKDGSKTFRAAQREISKAVVGMNIDQGTAIETAKAFQQHFGGDPTRLGFKNLSTAIRTFSVMGLNADEAVGGMARMVKQSNLSEKAARDLYGEVFVLGREFDKGDTVLKDYASKVGEIQTQLLKIGDTTPESMTKASRSIAILGGALSKAGIQDGVGKAVGVFKTLTDAQDAWQKGFAGLEGGQDSVLGQLAMVLGDATKAQELIRAKDPAKLIGVLADRMESLKVAAGRGDAGAGAQMKHLSEFAMKLEVPLEATSAELSKFNKRVTDMPKLLKNAGQELDDAAKKSHRTGRTLDEVLNMMKEGFESRMRGFLRRKGILSEFVTRQRDAYKRVGDAALELAEERGPLGALTRALLKVNTLGVKGLLHGFGPLASGVLDLAANVAPTVTAFGAMGLRFHHLLFPVKALLSPLGAMNAILGGLPTKLLGLAKIPALLGAGVMGLGFLSKGGGKMFAGVIDYAKNGLAVDILRAFTGFNKQRFAKEFGVSAKSMLASGAAWSIVGQGLSDGLHSAWTFAVENFDRGLTLVKKWGGVLLGWFEKGVDYLAGVDYGGLFDRVWNSIAEGLSTPVTDGNTIGRVAKALGTLLGTAWRAAKAVVGGLWSKLGDWWGGVEGTTSLAKVQTIFREHGETLGKALIGGMLLSSSIRGMVISSMGGLAKLALGGAGMAASGATGAAPGLWGFLSGGGMGKAPAANTMSGRYGTARDMGFGRWDSAKLSARDTAMNAWQGYKGGAASRFARGGLLGAAAGAVPLAMNAVMGKENKASDWGAAAGTTLGAALGTAVAGPLGAFLGGWLGGSLGERIGTWFNKTELPTQFEVFRGTLKRLNDEAAQIAATAEESVATIRAQMAPFESSRVKALQMIDGIKTEVRERGYLAANLAEMARNGKALDTTQRSLVLPALQELAIRGRIGAADLAKFSETGLLPARARAADVAGALQSMNERMRDPMVRAEEDYARKLKQIEVEQLEGKLKLQAQELTLQASLIRVKALQPSVARAVTGLDVMEGMMANDPRGRARDWSDSNMSHSGKGMELDRARQAMLARGVYVEESTWAKVRERLQQGGISVHGAFKEVTSTLKADMERETEVREKIAGVMVERAALELDGSKKMAKAAQDYATEFEIIRERASFSSRLTSAVAAKSITEAKAQEQLKFFESQAQQVRAGAMPMTGLSKIWAGEMKEMANGGIVMRKSYLTDASTGRTYATMAERGPEAVVPIGSPTSGGGDSGADLRDLIAVIRAEMSATRTTIERARPNVSVSVNRERPGLLVQGLGV